jgi:phosphoenolpyruvate synthase/pyruvate phosphate dikinase
MGHPHHIIDISQADSLDFELVGKKAFELGKLNYLGIPIPPGFIIETSFFEDFLKISGICKDMEDIKRTSRSPLPDCPEEILRPLREKIIHTDISPELTSELHKFYRELAGELRPIPVNVASSSDTDRSMFFPDVSGDANVFLKIKKIWADYLDQPVAIIISKSIISEIKGKISTNMPKNDKKLTEKQMTRLLQYCKIIQSHFYFPKEVDYAVENGKIYITGVNPFTGTVSVSHGKILHFNKGKEIAVRGISVCRGIATGPVRIINSPSSDLVIRKDEILIVPSLNIFLFKNIKNPKAIVAEATLATPGDKAHYRKNFQVPTVEGVRNATQVFRNGDVVTVNGINGSVYSGGFIR